MSKPTLDEDTALLVRVLACTALTACIADDLPTVHRSMVSIAELNVPGVPAIELAMHTWAGLMSYHMIGGATRGPLTKGRPTVIETTCGEFIAVGSARADTELPADFLWAVSAVEALIMEDDSRWDRLWGEAVASGRAGEHVGAVLQVVTDTIKNTPFGYGRDGLHRPDPS